MLGQLRESDFVIGVLNFRWEIAVGFTDFACEICAGRTILSASALDKLSIVL